MAKKKKLLLLLKRLLLKRLLLKLPLLLKLLLLLLKPLLLKPLPLKLLPLPLLLPSNTGSRNENRPSGRFFLPAFCCGGTRVT